MSYRNAQTWETVRIVLQPRQGDWRHIHIGIIRGGSTSSPELVRHEVLHLEVVEGLETADDVADFLIAALS